MPMPSRPAANSRKSRGVAPAKSADEQAFNALNLRRFADGAETREQEIIIAAFHCISSVGIAATTTRAVAQRAGMNLGAIHYYFRSKDALLLGVLQQLMRHKISIFRTIRRSNLTPTEKMHCLLRSGSVFMQRQDEVVATIALWAHALAQGGSWQSTYRKLFDELRNELKVIIDDGLDTGEFRNADSTLAAETIIVAVQGISMHYVMTPSDFGRENLADRLVHVFFPLLGIDE
jgi:AcrR family transcriptional regulator